MGVVVGVVEDDAVGVVLNVHVAVYGDVEFVADMC